MWFCEIAQVALFQKNAHCSLCDCTLLFVRLHFVVCAIVHWLVLDFRFPEASGSILVSSGRWGGVSVVLEVNLAFRKGFPKQFLHWGVLTVLLLERAHGHGHGAETLLGFIFLYFHLTKSMLLSKAHKCFKKLMCGDAAGQHISFTFTIQNQCPSQKLFCFSSNNGILAKTYYVLLQ